MGPCLCYFQSQVELYILICVCSSKGFSGQVSFYDAKFQENPPTGLARMMLQTYIQTGRYAETSPLYIYWQHVSGFARDIVICLHEKVWPSVNQHIPTVD